MRRRGPMSTTANISYSEAVSVVVGQRLEYHDHLDRRDVRSLEDYLPVKWW